MSNEVAITQNTSIVNTFADMERLANAIAKSRMFGLTTPEAALTLMAIANAEGRPAAIAAIDYHIINNKPCLKADAMLARFQQAGGKVEWHEYSDERAEATFTHPAGGSIKLSWDLDRAKRAEVMGNPTWKKYPRAMLRARTISEGIRTVYPGILNGMYAPEEIEDMQAERPKPAAVQKLPARKLPEDAEFTEVKPTPVIAQVSNEPHRINIEITASGHSDWTKWVQDFGASIRSAKDSATFEAWLAENQEPLGGLRKICEETENKLYSRVMALIDQLAPKNQTIEQQLEAAE